MCASQLSLRLQSKTMHSTTESIKRYSQDRERTAAAGCGFRGVECCLERTKESSG